MVWLRLLDEANNEDNFPNEVIHQNLQIRIV